MPEASFTPQVHWPEINRIPENRLLDKLVNDLFDANGLANEVTGLKGAALL